MICSPIWLRPQSVPNSDSEGHFISNYPILLSTDEKIIPSGEAYVCHDDVGEENTKQRHQPCVKTTTSK